jgi:energy-coupling factor transporter ATP-binding protein EcfA2
MASVTRRSYDAEMRGGLDFEGTWTTVPIAEALALARTLHHIEQKGAHSVGTSVSCGYPDLDEETGGLPSGALTLITGAPGAGKTAFALTINRHIAAKSRGEVLYVTGTDPIAALMMRLLSYEANVLVREISRGRLRQTSWTDLGSAVKLPSALVSFLEDPTDPFDSICAAAAMIQRERSLRSVFVEPVSSVRGWSDDPIAWGSVSSRLRRMAAHHAVPVVVVTQPVGGDRPQEAGESDPELSPSQEPEPASAPTGGPAVRITVRRAHCEPPKVHMVWDDAHVRITQPVPAGGAESLRSEGGEGQRDRAS